MGEVGHLEYSGGTVPEDGPGLKQDFLPFRNSFGSGVHAHPSVRNGVRRAYLCAGVVVESVGGNYGVGKIQPDSFLLRFRKSVQSCLYLVVFHE